MSYGSLYNQLRKDPNLTEEEAHDRALGFALTSGAITGVITSGFSAIGRGGVEDALLKGMTFRESKKVFQAMGNTGGVTNETVKKAMTKVMNDSIKKYGSATLGKKIVKNVVDESFEEGVDQLVNSFVEDVALNQDTPMLERMKQVWHAAQVGGILGGGVPAIQAGASRLGVTPMDQREQRIRMVNEFAEQVSSELEGKGSPLAAAQFREIMMTRIRGGAAEAAPEPAPLLPSEVSETVTEETLLRTENAKRSKEIAQEISKLDDESTLPENAEEREAEVAVREQRRIELGQESMALSQEEQNFRVAAQSPTTPDDTFTDQQVDPEVFLQSLNESSPLDVEIAFENIRNQQNINFNNSEDTTVLKIEGIEDPSVPAAETPFDYGRKSPRKIKDYAGGPSIDFTQEQTNAESVGVSLQGESRTNISSTNSNSRGFDPSKSKRYSSRPSSGTLRFDDPPFSGPDAEEKANKLIDFAISHGFPLNLDPNVSYGLPMPSESSRQSLSEFVASAVYTAYPKLAPPKNAKLDTSKRPDRTYFDPVSGKTVRQPVKFFVDDSGNGIFDNDPISIIEMLRAAKTVKVPRSFNRANLNPAIRIKDGRVTDVVGPTADGRLLESKLGNARDVSSIEPNNARAAALASIPFKPATLPDGVADFDPENGGPIEGEFFGSTTDIKNRINRFALELEKTGDETNDDVQARFKTLSGERGLEFHAAALESAKQEFLFNAQLFSLREKLLSNPATIIDEVVAQTGSKNVEQAAQKLLPFVKVESNINLTGGAVIGLFVGQKLQNNPDFANNATPTFDTLLRKATDRFKLQQDDANSLREQRAVSTLPFDVAPAEFRNAKVSGWIANFGRNPDGELASPQDISDAVSGAIDTAIGAVNTSPDLRVKVNEIILDEVLNDPTPEMKDMVQNASAEDVFGLFTSWMSSGNGDTRPSVNKLVDAIEKNELSTSGTDFLNALLLVNFATRSDGASYENSDAVSAYQALFTDAVGTQISIDEAKNTMIALTKAVRTHLSRSNISAAERATITAENEADIERLGLESGNPDSVIKALKEVAKNSDNPSHKVVADLLLRDTDLIKGVKFVLGETTADIAGKYIKGNDGSHTVFINVTSGNGRGLVNTLLEEYVHAFISDTISSTEAQRGSVRGTKTRIKSLSTVLSNARTAYAKQKKESGPVPSLENALVDLNEFTAQFLLSEEVQKHVRDLKPAPNRSSFLSRFLTNLAMLFPNVGRGDASKVAESLEDVIDVGKNTHNTTTTNAKALGGQIGNAVTLFSSPVTQTESRIERAEALREMQRETEQARLEAKRQKDVEDAERFLEGVSEADRPKVRELYNYIRGLVPVGMDIKLTTESDGSAAFVSSDSSAIFINLPVMLSQTGDVSDIAGRAIAGVIINEELTHTASFNALTAEEIQNYINSLSDSDYVDIAKEYLVGNEGRLATTLASLQSSDPQEVAKAKYQLAEEKLRMHLQKVTRGFTTEDDTQFWKSKPSLLRILNRYFRGIINRWVANRKKIGPAADVALNKLIIEMRAIEVGFVRQPTKMAFNPENPMEAFRMFGTVNQDFVRLASAPVAGEYPESAEFPTSAYNTIHGGADIPSGLSDNNKVAAYLRDQAVEFWGVEVNEEGTTPVGDEETFLTPITAKSITSEQEAKIVDIATEETLQALAADGEDAADWYTTSVESAMAVASVIYPELSNPDLARESKAFSSSENPDQAADLVMKMALAITSQNLKVSENTRYADEQYKIFRETGRYDESAVYGSKGAAIQSNLILANAFVDKLGFDKTIEFIESDFSVKSLNQELKKMGLDVKVAGTQGTEVQGAAIFGPKIGQGFLQNLRASVMKVAGKGYIPVTVDLWLRRTWGRWTGDSAGKGLTTNLVAEFLRVARETKTMPDISEDLVEKVAKTYAEIESEDTKAKPNDNHISRAKSAIKGVQSLRVNKTGKDLTKKSSESLSDNPDYQIAVFVIGKFVNSMGEKAYQRTREPLPSEIINNIRKGDYDPLEIFTYLENRSSEFENTYVTTKGVAKADAKMEFFKNFDASEEIMEPSEVRGLKLPWQNVAKRVKESIKPIDSPTNLEREVISRVINKVRINLESLGMYTTNADIQAILWYPEKDIWQKLQGGDADSLKMSYDQAYENLAKELGPEIYEKAIEARQEVVRRRRDRTARNSIAPQQGADGAANRGTVENSEASPSRERRLSGDRAAPDGPVILGSAPMAGASGQPTGSNIDFSAVVDLLEIPVYELETGKPQNFIMEFLNNVFAGELPEAFRRLIQNRDAYKRLTEANVVVYKKKMDKLIKETYGGYENAPMEMIALAQGHYTGNMVTDEVLDAIEKDYDDAHADAERKRKAGEITDEQADSLKGLAHNARTEATDKAYEEALDSREADRAAALRDLAKDSPELAAHIIDIRQELIIPLQKKLIASGLDDKIGAKISKTGGIYITRSYQMFTDSSYLQKVREDPDYQDVRDTAMKFFNDQYIKNKVKELVDGGMDESRAKVEARILLERENQSSPHGSFAQDSLNSFLMQYEKGGRDSTTATPKSYKMIEDNLRRRKDLPEPIRNLLGEIGSESGIDLILRTYSTVATIASQQAFLNQLVEYGERTGLMVTVKEKLSTAENRAKYANFEAARSGAPSKNDPLSGMLVDPEFKELLDVALMDSLSMGYADTAEKAVKGAVGLAANLSGKAMAAKTLGSIGFYLRNGIGNLLFGTSQGFFRYDTMISKMVGGTVGVFKDGEIDPEISELIGLNIMGDELRAGVLKDLLNGKVTPDGIRKQIEDLGEKTKLNKATKALAMIEKKAQDLSAALDAAYKVAYYKHELAILMEAKAADTSTVKEGEEKGVNNLAAMEDMEIKRLAARKVVMTSQAYSQAPPAVAAYTKSGLGLLFAPFIRFKMEVPRIVINTFKLASEEIASGNPVLVQRGKLRRRSMIGTIGVLSSALPMALAALSGIGDEEDEAMRASIPDYLRGHTFFYYRWNGELKSVDLTYVNPYSLLVDPFLRGYENIRRGEFTEAGAAIALGLVRDQYLDDQILAGAVSEARRNLNPSTGKPIWNKGADGPMEAGSKILGHIAKEAYAPRLGKDFVEGWSTGSLKGMTLEIMDGAMPFRIHDVDLQKQYSRYLLDLNNRFNNVKSGLNAVKRNVPMSDGDVADIIDENIEDRRLLNYELMRINKGFASLGLTDTDLLKGMKDKKLGRDRVALLSKGYMDKPSFKYIIESLLDPRTDEYGRARAQQIYDHASKINRYIPVRPITESE